MAFELPAWLNQSNTDLIPNAIAKGTQAGATIASGIRANRQQALDERQRELSNDIRRKEVSALLTWRQAQASKETAKLEAAAEKAASEKMFWDVVGGGMDQWRLANPDAPMEKEREQFQSLVARNWHMRGSGQAIPAPLLKAPLAPMAQPTEFESGGGKFVTGPKGQILQVKPPVPERDTRTTTQKDTQALVESESAARMARGEPPLNPAEETARTAEVLGKRVAGSGKEKVQTAKQSDLEYLRTLSDPKEIDIFTTMLLGRAGQPKNEAQKLKYFSAQEKLRALKDQVFKKDEYDAAVKKILSDYEASLGESQTPATEPEKKFKFEFKGDRLQSVK